MNAPAQAGPGSGFARFRATLSRQDRISTGGMYGFIVLLHLIGFGVLLLVVVPRGYNLAVPPVFTASGSASWPTPSGYGMPSTPTTSPRLTTPPAS